MQESSKGPRYVNTTRPRPKPGVLPTKRPVPVPVKRPPPKADKHALPSDEPPPPKKAAPPSPVAPEDMKELDPLTASVLEEELEKLLRKSWLEPPEQLKPESETVVANKLRKEVENQFKQTIGLNVTKRLLNTLNPLNVKVHFTTKPERKYLRQFLKEYSFVSFKRVARETNAFAAQLRAGHDYDRLCRHRDIHCGAAKITVTPLYRYKQCPKNLKTVYKIPEEAAIQVTDDDIDIADDDNESSPINICVSPDASKSAAESNKDVKKEPEENDDSKTVTGKTEIKVEPVPEEAANKAKDVGNKPIDEQKTSETKPTIEKNTAPVKNDVENPITRQETENKPPVKKNTAPAKNDVENPITKRQETEKQPPVKKNTAPVENPITRQETENKPPVNKNTAPVENPITRKETENKPPVKKNTAPVKNDVENPIINRQVTENKSAAKEEVNKISAAKIQAKETGTAKTETPKPKVETEITKPKPVAPINETKDVSSNATTKNVPAVVKPPVKTVAKPKANVKTSPKVVGKPVKPTPTPNKVNARTNAAKVGKKTTETAKTVMKGSKPDPKRNVKKTLEQTDDFEELDDEAILALMSGGIVLDECSGSDVE